MLRRIALFGPLLCAGIASADPHAEMAAALAAQADVRPPPAILPRAVHTSTQTAATSAQTKAQTQAGAPAAQAQAAAAAAASQARDNSAKANHEHPVHPTHPTHPTH